MALPSAVSTSLKRWASQLGERMNIPVTVRWKGGDEIKLGQSEAPKVSIDILDTKGATALMNPSLDQLGEAYVEGHMDVSGSAEDIMDVAWQLAQAGTDDGNPAGWLHRIAKHVADASSHNQRQDREAIQYHYDVSNDFYAAWLDPAMLYSCAYFENGNESLADAQTAKLDHILSKLRIEPGQRLLDIGCGWGALVLRAAQKFGAHCVGITLSENQFELANQRVSEAGLQDQIEIRLQDYRDVGETFDRISSVGMCEHVGLKNLRQYFQIVHDRLAPGGWVLNHNITSTDADNAETTGGGGEFIDRYVFPHGELPHVSTILDHMQRAGLEAIDVESLRRHYARTLAIWSRNFETKTEKLKAMVDEKTWRIWRVYLVGCEWAFANDEVSVYQVLCHRAGQPADTLPWSRRWQYDT